MWRPERSLNNPRIADTRAFGFAGEDPTAAEQFAVYSAAQANAPGPQAPRRGAFVIRNLLTSPPSPHRDLRIQYRNRLPPSDGVILDDFGQEKRRYGSTRVTIEHTQLWEACRLRMFQADSVTKKYIIEAETNPDIITDIYPHSVFADGVNILGEERPVQSAKLYMVNRPRPDGSMEWRAVLTFPIDIGYIFPNGQVACALTRGLHEYAHAPRYKIVNGNLHPPEDSNQPDEIYQDLDEFGVINQVENTVARRFREGERDSYEVDGEFLVSSPESLDPTNLQAAQLIRTRQPQLQEITRVMRQFGFPSAPLSTSTGPNQSLGDLLLYRAQMHFSLVTELATLLPTRASSSPSSENDTSTGGSVGFSPVVSPRRPGRFS